MGAVACSLYSFARACEATGLTWGFHMAARPQAAGASRDCRWRVQMSWPNAAMSATRGQREPLPGCTEQFEVCTDGRGGAEDILALCSIFPGGAECSNVGAN